MKDSGESVINLIRTTRATTINTTLTSQWTVDGVNKILNMTDSRGKYPDIPLGEYIGISTGISAGFGIVINAMVITVIMLARKGRYSTYKYLMLHLAFADLLCAIMLVPYVPLELGNHDWSYPKATCKVIYPTISMLTNVSTGTILIITVERFRGVLFPHARAWNSDDVWKAFVIVWSISLLSVLPNIITLQVKQYDNLVYCNEVWTSWTLKRLYGFSFLAVSFFLPLLCIIIMHSMIMIRLRFNDLVPDNFSAHQQNQNRRIMRVLTGIIIVFFFTVSPNKILYFVWDIAPQLEISLTSKVRLYLRTFQIFYWLRVAVNPLIYCFFDTRFTSDLKKSSKIVRGRSFLDSEAPRSRSASQRTSTILSVRSRANSSFIGEAEEVHGMMKAPTAIRMTSIDEMDITSLNTLYSSSENNGHCLKEQTDDVMEGRARSVTVDTDISTQNGSASPLV